MSILWYVMSKEANGSKMIHKTKDLGHFRVELNFSDEKGQILIWTTADDNERFTITSSDDGKWDCISAIIYSDQREAMAAYDNYVSTQQIENIFSCSGFGKSRCA